jgi:beta-lactamase regulating signal transducer with metallopeptidase domain
MNAILEQINSAGLVFVKFAVPMLLQSSVLITVLLLIDLLLRKKVRAVFRYWLWMLVLLKLVLPTTLSSPVSLGSWFGDKLADIKVSDISSVAQPVNVPQITKTEITAVTVKPSLDVKMTATPLPDAKQVVAEAAILPAVSPISPTWQGIVFMIWAAVVIAMGLLLLQRAIFVVGLVAQAQNPTQLMNDAFQFCCGQMGTKGKVSLKVSANTAGPAVCGLFRPVILVPQNLAPALGSSHLRPVLLHELAHIRRGDLWINLVQTILQIIYFYNPFLWLANAVIRRIREQAVDETVQVAMGANAPQYPQTLVDVAKLAFSRPALSLRLIGVVESKSALKGRIERMLNHPIPKTAKLGILSLTTLFIFAAIVLPMAKAKSNSARFVIKGVVTDAETGQPIAGAKVGDDKYAGGQFWTTTDANGFYSYNTWYEEHNIKCEASGYKTQNTGFGTKLFGSEEEKVINFALEPSDGSENNLEGKKQQPTNINAKKKKILEKLVVLNEQRNRLQRDVDAIERALGEVRDRWNFTDLEEHDYPHPIAERLNRLQKEQDDCALEISQVKTRVENLKADSNTEQGQKYLKDTQNLLAELQAKFDTLEKMRIEAAERKRELDLANIQYKQRAAIRDERLQRLNETKSQIERLRLAYENPEVFDVPAEVDDKSKAAVGTIDVAVEDFRINPYPAGGLYTVTVAIRNKGSQEAPPFRLNFYQSDPANNLNLHGKPQTGSHGAGPIKPGDVWNESSSPFALKEGLNEITVVLNTDQRVPESDETNNRAFMRLIVKDGQIKEKSVSYSTQQKTENPPEQTAQPIDLKKQTKILPEQNPLNEAVYKQLDRTVDLSGLTPNMPFGEAIALLKNSVDPPLKIVVLWQVLSDNTNIEQHTPINIDAIPPTRLGTALKLLLKSVSDSFAELDYTVEDGIIYIATIESLPAKFETRVYDISDLTSSTAGAGDIAEVIIKTVEPDRWEVNDGKGTVDIYDNKLVFYQTIEIHKQIQDVLQELRNTQAEKGQN